MNCEIMTIEQGYQQLAGAICEQAVADYLVAIILEKERGRRYHAKVAELESFFRSDWFRFLTRENIDGEWVMSEVKERCRTSRHI